MTKARRPRKPKAVDPPGPPEVEGLESGDPSQAKPQVFLWPGQVPAGCLTLLEGRKGVGKSTIMGAIAAAVTGGGSLPGWAPVCQRSVIWCRREESWEVAIIPRLLALGANVRWVRNPTVKRNDGQKRPLVLPEDAWHLERMIRESGAALVILDSIGSLCSPSVDLRVPQQARAYAETIGGIADRTGCSFLGSNHLTKGAGKDTREQGYHSAELLNVARCVLRAEEHPYERDLWTLSTVATNAGAVGPTLTYRVGTAAGEGRLLDWVGTCDLTTEEIAEGRGSQAQRDEWHDADALLCRAIGEEPRAAKLLYSEADMAGVTPAMLRAAKARLRVPSRRVAHGDAPHWEWHPPESGWPASLLARLEEEEGAQGE